MRCIWMPILLLATPLYAATAMEIRTTLSGAAVMPGPGESLGKGNARFQFDRAHSKICYDLRLERVPGVNMAHIHKGAVGTSGPPLVHLKMPMGGVSQGCTSVPANVLEAMIAHPNAFYVNVHSVRYPEGAVRGQLGR